MCRSMTRTPITVMCELKAVNVTIPRGITLSRLRIDGSRSIHRLDTLKINKYRTIHGSWSMTTTVLLLHRISFFHQASYGDPPLPSISSEMAILSTSPVNDTRVFLLSIPDVPSNTCTTARLPKTSKIWFHFISFELKLNVIVFEGQDTTHKTRKKKARECKAKQGNVGIISMRLPLEHNLFQEIS